jgi:type IV pilus assembly protein PilA
MNQAKFSNQGFNLLELLVVITIVGILSAVAVPAYNNYMLRAKIDGMRHSASAAQFAVAADYANTNQLASINYQANSTPFTTGNANYIASISITQGIITVTGLANKLGNRNIVMTFTPSLATDNSLNWKCSSNPESSDLMPQDCQN